VQQTRQRILDFLDQRGSATAGELAKMLGMTAANLRRHLGILEDRNLVAIIGQRPTEGRGRRELIFALISNQTSVPEILTRSLLKTLGAKNLSRKPESRLKLLAESLLGPRSEPLRQITQRLVTAVRQMQPLGYKPHWEARQAGPQMVLSRCPYAAIIADHPELCRMDAHILESLLSAPVEQTAKLQPGPQQIPQCIFKVINN
jgi:predicted ArsR family transcriptional regulator